ncbi:hypothetical protein J2Z32_002321 [Paenibacillus turicensis]|uniref:Uncharacterized protein n=1 Tax=Paenibacillus turicensis TaxID=160487 RepID=A0ABS4FSW2_9BACL|nr:hypothetical protein [Paenibacillus turicensis]MBP1905673.1 hypothetical protein [Paenibacillus turicensis]
MYQTIRRKISKEFADILLAKKLGADISKDGKYFLFTSSVTSDEYDRQRRELKRENEKIYSGMPRYSKSIDRANRFGHATPYSYNKVYGKSRFTI